MAKVHPLSYVDSKADLADDVEVGPFCNVEAEVQIGHGCILDSHVTIKTGVTLGANNFMGQGVVLGGDPQDRRYHGERTFLTIGDNNNFREFVTVHRANNEDGATVVGSDNYLMANVHVGHNAVIHDHVTIANSVGISGHVTIEDLVTIGGMTGVHQFARIGRASMVGGMLRIVRDVPPFMLIGIGEEVHDINAVGLRRIGISSQSRMALHKACKLLFKSQLGLSNAMEIVRREVPMTEEVEYLLRFEEMRSKGKNGRQDQK